MSMCDSQIAIITDSDRDSDNSVTLLNIKDNLKNYYLSKLRSLASVLIDSLNDLAKGKENLKNAMEKCEEEVIEMFTQMEKVTNEKERLKEELAKYEEKVVELSVQVDSNKTLVRSLIMKMID